MKRTINEDMRLIINGKRHEEKQTNDVADDNFHKHYY